MITEKPRVSVIIPCFNQGQFIDEAVNSVLNQTFQEFEIIIINDGSTDEYTIKKFSNYDRPKCKLININNRGLSSARNTGIEAASCEYILPLDADDKIGPKYLEEAVKILDRESAIGIVYCDAEFFGDKTGKWVLPEYSINKLLIMNMIICTGLFRKADYLNTAGYNPNMKYGWEDWDFWLSLIELGKGVYKLPDVHFYYRIKNNDSMLNNLNQSVENRRYSLNAIYLNHIGFYLDKMGNPIELYSKWNKLLVSKDYRIGRLIINPLRKLKKEVKKFCSK